MPRQRQYANDAERQKAYRQRVKRNALSPVDVTKSNEIYCLDVLLFLQNLGTGSAKVIITSPPYNLRNSSGGWSRAKTAKTAGRWGNAALRNGYDMHDDNMPRRDYVKWQKACLVEMLRVIPDDGAIFYIHKPRVQNGLIESPEEIVSGFPVRQVIIWDRGNGFNFNDSYFCPHYEQIYMIAKSAFRLKPGTCGWGDVWRIAPDKDNDHPAPFPVALPYRILSSIDMQNQIVVDPFAGSGPVGMVAKMLKIDYKLNDNSPKYVEMARLRISSSPASYPRYLFQPVISTA